MGKTNLGLDFDINRGISIYRYRNVKVVKHIYLKSAILGMFLGVINGFFGGGGGMIAVPVLNNLFGFEDKASHATTIFIMLPLSIVSCIVYYIYNGFSYNYTIVTVVSIVIGGALGAVLLKKINNKFLNIIFSIVIIYGGIRLIL